MSTFSPRPSASSGWMSLSITSCRRAVSVQNTSSPKVSSRKMSRPCRARSFGGSEWGNWRHAASETSRTARTRRTPRRSVRLMVPPLHGFSSRTGRAPRHRDGPHHPCQPFGYFNRAHGARGGGDAFTEAAALATGDPHAALRRAPDGGGAGGDAGDQHDGGAEESG